MDSVGGPDTAVVTKGRTSTVPGCSMSSDLLGRGMPMRQRAPVAMQLLYALIMTRFILMNNKRHCNSCITTAEVSFTHIKSLEGASR